MERAKFGQLIHEGRKLIGWRYARTPEHIALEDPTLARINSERMRERLKYPPIGSYGSIGLFGIESLAFLQPIYPAKYSRTNTHETEE